MWNEQQQTSALGGYSTISLPRIMFISHVKMNSPALSGVNSIGVVLNAGRSRIMPK